MQNILPKLTIGAAQIETRLGELDMALEDHLAVIDEARSKNVDVLLFPEMSLTGHSAGPYTLELAIGRRSDIVRRIAQASGPMVTMFGLIEEAGASQFYNSMYVVRNGVLQHIHRKLTLATYGQLEDGKHFGSGRFVETYEIDQYWRSGILICNDLWNPALVHLIALHGITCLFAPISSAREAIHSEFDNPGAWDINLRFYALTYGMPVIMANRVGVERDLSFWGGSRIIDPMGSTIAIAEEPTPQLLIGEIDYREVRKARYRLPTVRDSNLDLFLRETQRLQGIIGVPDMVRSTE